MVSGRRDRGMRGKSSRPWVLRSIQSDIGRASPGSVNDFAELTDKRRRPTKCSAGAEAEDRRPQSQRQDHVLVARRRAQADVPHHRLQAPQGRRPGHRGGHRVRSEPLLPHRPDRVPRQDQELHPGPRGPEGRRLGGERRGTSSRRSATPCRSSASRSAWTCTISR